MIEQVKRLIEDLYQNNDPEQILEIEYGTQDPQSIHLTIEDGPKFKKNVLFWNWGAIRTENIIYIGLTFE